MALTNLERIDDIADRALDAIARARAAVGDGPTANAELDRLADSVADTRDGAQWDCFILPGPYFPGPADSPAETCEKAVARMESVARVAIEAANTLYTRAGGGSLPGDESDEDPAPDGSALPPPPAGAGSSLGPILLAVSSVLGFLLGVLR